MKNKEISYYELLGMIKERNIPNKISVQLAGVNHKEIYKADYDKTDDSFLGYILDVEDVLNEVGDYKFYLAECFLESSMFDKCIEIVEDGFIKEIEIKDGNIICYYDNNIHYMNTNAKDREIYIKLINQLIRNQNKILQKLNK